MSRDPGPVGIFDSGLGGLSVWREVRRALPAETLCYVADQRHVPYGPRPREELRALTARIAGFLIEQDCKLVVVACNAASAAALGWLRERFPDTPFVGMEPAVKPAAASSRNRCAGVLATPATLAGELYRDTVARHAADMRIVAEPCPGLVERIEAGAVNDEETQEMLARFLQPILLAGADTVVLACTHYPFVIEAIRALAGPGVSVIDPAPAVARQVARRLDELGWRAPATDGAATMRDRFYTSGDPTVFSERVEALLGLSVTAVTLP